jgi:hypothetical protein
MSVALTSWTISGSRAAELGETVSLQARASYYKQKGRTSKGNRI